MTSYYDYDAYGGGGGGDDCYDDDQRYRGPAIKALQTAVKHFGGDCIPSFHLLSDNMTDVPHPLKAYDIPYRTWPESGLYVKELTV